MGKKSTASEHLNQLHWAQTYPKGMGKKGTQVPFDPSPTRSRTLHDIELDVVITRDCYVKRVRSEMCCTKGPTVFRPHHRVSNYLQIRIKDSTFYSVISRPYFGGVDRSQKLTA